jgi:thiol-disulfide isomerase/thioredoxin
VHIPSLGGATEWLDTEPVGPAELRGRVVQVNFWTWTCINCLRQEPYVRGWSQAYRDDGLVVIGVHTPEFSFEHEIDGVRQATRQRAIDYPVAVDNDDAIWSAFANHYWPALYFVDADGIIRDHHFGEGRYEQSERVIQRAAAWGERACRRGDTTVSLTSRSPPSSTSLADVADTMADERDALSEIGSILSAKLTLLRRPRRGCRPANDGQPGRNQ